MPDLWAAAGSEPELTDDLARIITRANCLSGIRQLTYEHHTAVPHVSIAVETVSQFTVKNERQFDSSACRLLRVAWQTELAARLGSAFDDSALTRVAMQTLPVNTYYALFNALRALGRVQGAPTDTHRAAQDVFARSRAGRLPVPWCATLAGDPEDLRTCQLAPSGLLVPFAVDPMKRSHEPAAYLFAALRTTRRWKLRQQRVSWLGDAANRKKDGGLRKRLPAGEAARIATRLRPTTLLDFVYELRRSANYETADEYGAEVNDSDIARFQVGMEHLLDTGMLVIETQLAALAGVKALEQQAQAWSKTAKRVGSWAEEPLERRLAAVDSALR